MSPHDKRKAADAGERRAAAFQDADNEANDTHLTNTVKLAEFIFVLGFSFKKHGDHQIPCGCCGTATANLTIEPLVFTIDDQILVAKACPTCAVEAKATGGLNIRSVIPFTMDEIDELLLSGAEWLDSALLRENQNELFIRRPTFAEIQEAQSVGAILAASSAVVVSPHGERGISRRFMPFPFPWDNNQEWWAGPIAAQSAIDLADAIERGEVDMYALRSKIVLSASTETMDRLMWS